MVYGFTLWSELETVHYLTDYNLSFLGKTDVMKTASQITAGEKNKFSSMQRKLNIAGKLKKGKRPPASDKK